MNLGGRKESRTEHLGRCALLFGYTITGREGWVKDPSWPEILPYVESKAQRPLCNDVLPIGALQGA